MFSSASRSVSTKRPPTPTPALMHATSTLRSSALISSQSCLTPAGLARSARTAATSTPLSRSSAAEISSCSLAELTMRSYPRAASSSASDLPMPLECAGYQCKVLRHDYYPPVSFTNGPKSLASKMSARPAATPKISPNTAIRAGHDSNATVSFRDSTFAVIRKGIKPGKRPWMVVLGNASVGPNLRGSFAIAIPF